jgi:predicted  nucleic acid-binding Zn-ribbon protein
MSDLEKRLEASLKSVEKSGQKLVKKLTTELRIANERLAAAEKAVQDRKAAVYHAQFKLAEAVKRRNDAQQRDRVKGRIEYNHKVRNR